MEGLIGKKVGMTQIFDADGKRVCVTVIEVGPCPVVQLKTEEKDGYVAAQLGFGEQKKQRLTKAVAGHQEKTGGLVDRKVRILREFALDAGEAVGGSECCVHVHDVVFLSTKIPLLLGSGTLLFSFNFSILQSRIDMRYPALPCLGKVIIGICVCVVELHDNVLSFVGCKVTHFLRNCQLFHAFFAKYRAFCCCR